MVLAEAGRCISVMGTSSVVGGSTVVGISSVVGGSSVVGASRAGGIIGTWGPRMKAFVDDVDVCLLVVVRHARKVSQSIWIGSRTATSPENIGSSGPGP